MSKKNIIFQIFLILFAIIGIISIILFIVEKNPINSIDWEALASIGTLLAVFVALFITKWQDIINNRKSLNISWLYIEKDSIGRSATSKITDKIRKDEICLRFINTGNRKIVLDIVSLEYNKNKFIFLIPNIITPAGEKPAMVFPCVLETEMASQFYFSFSWFSALVNKLLNENIVNKNDEIIIVAKDTTEKKYTCHTGIKYSLFLQDEYKNSDYSNISFNII